jgi:hypothetical protein
MLPCGVTVSNRNHLSRSETRGLMLSWEDEICAYLNQMEVRNLLVVSVSVLQSSEEQLLYCPVQFTIWLFQTISNAVFKCISWLNGSFLGSEHQGSLKRESRPIKRHQACLITRQVFSCLHIYSLWTLFFVSFFVSIIFFLIILRPRCIEFVRNVLLETVGPWWWIGVLVWGLAGAVDKKITHGDEVTSVVPSSFGLEPLHFFTLMFAPGCRLV